MKKLLLSMLVVCGILILAACSDGVSTSDDDYLLWVPPASPNPTVYGLVYDSSGNLVVGAEVDLYYRVSDTSWQLLSYTTTNQYGGYYFASSNFPTTEGKVSCTYNGESGSTSGWYFPTNTSPLQEDILLN